MKTYTTKDFEEYLSIYTDIIRNGFRSNLIDNVFECLNVMIYFEEYEKCKDLLPYTKGINNRPASEIEPN